MQLINHLLPILLLAVAGTDFLAAMHPDLAAGTSGASSSNAGTEPDHHNVDYDNEGTVGSVRVGSSGKPTEFLIVDTHEPDAARYGHYGYLLVLRDMQIRLGNKQLNSAKHTHKSPCAARIELTLSEQQNPDLKAPKDLEGIELEMVYGFLYHSSKDYWAGLNNGKMVKKVTVKIPKMKNAPPTEEEKEILKGIFIGGHKFRVEVQKDGNVEIKFQKNLSPSTMKFTTNYSNFSTGKGKIVKASYSIGKYYGLEFESISLPKSTFTINCADAGIREVEELRAVTFHIRFELVDDEYHNLTDYERVHPHYREIPFRDLKEDILEQLFVGGEATIHLSKEDYVKSRIEIGAAPVTKPESDLTPGTMKFTASYRNFLTEKGQMVAPPYVYRKDYKFENISLPESTFTIDWAKSNIKEAEQLRTVRISISFKLEDDKYIKVPDNQRGVYSRSMSFQDLSNDFLEELFVGGETTIHLSKVDNGKSGIEIVAGPATKPKSSVFETVKTKVLE